MPWIIGDVEDKIQTALGMGHLTSLDIDRLDSKSWVANEFLDVLTCYDFPENGIDKLNFINFKPKCEPFEEEVVSRLANICSQLSNLRLENMKKLSESGRMSMVSLFRQIIQQNPQI